MFNINDEVIHKSAGACFIKDIVSKNFGSGERTYYCLKPKFENQVNKSLEIFLPIEKGVEFLRKPISKTEVLVLISDIPKMKKIWIREAKARKLMFEQIYHSGDLKGFCQLVKLLYVEPEFFEKPMSLTDKNFLYKVRNHLYGEFALALNMVPEQVEDFIKTQLNQSYN